MSAYGRLWRKIDPSSATAANERKIKNETTVGPVKRFAKKPQGIERQDSIETSQTVQSNEDACLGGIGVPLTRDSEDSDDDDANKSAIVNPRKHCRTLSMDDIVLKTDDTAARPMKKTATDCDDFFQTIMMILLEGKKGAKTTSVDMKYGMILLKKQIVKTKTIHEQTFYVLDPRYRETVLTTNKIIERILDELGKFNRFRRESWDTENVLELATELSSLIKTRDKHKSGILPLLNAKMGDILYYGLNNVKEASRIFSDSSQLPYCAAMKSFLSEESSTYIVEFTKVLTNVGVDGQILTLMAMLKRPDDAYTSAIATYFVCCMILSPTCLAMTNFKAHIEQHNREAFDFLESGEGTTFLDRKFLGRNKLIEYLVQDLLDRVKYAPKRLDLHLMMKSSDIPSVLLCLCGLAMAEHIALNFSRVLAYVEFILVLLRQQNNSNSKRVDSLTSDFEDIEMLIATAEERKLRNVANALRAG